MPKRPSAAPAAAGSRESVRSKLELAADAQERLRILYPLLNLEAPWVCDLLLDCLADPKEHVREFIIKELVRREDLDLEHVCRKLSDLPWFVRSCCLRILGQKKDPRWVPRIAAVTADPNADVRVWAAWALGEIGGEKSLSILARMAREPNRFVRLAAEKALIKASPVKFV